MEEEVIFDCQLPSGQQLLNEAAEAVQGGVVDETSAAGDIVD